MTLGGFSSASWESSADVGNAWSGGGFGVVGFRVSDRLSLGFGAGASSQLEDDPFVFPVVTIEWQITDRLRLENEMLGVRLTFEVNDRLDLYARGAYERREYRLDDGHALIGEGVFRDTRVPLGFGVSWRPVEGLDVGLEAGASLLTELEFETSGGREVEETDADAAPYIALRVRYSF